MSDDAGINFVLCGLMLALTLALAAIMLEVKALAWGALGLAGAVMAAWIWTALAEWWRELHPDEP